MKPIRVLEDPPAGLAEYLDSVDNANWNEFCSHNVGASLRELRDTLAANQHGLCAYCEIEISGSGRQIEHVIPRSDIAVGKQMALDVANMIACCMGGTVELEHESEDYFQRPIRDNMSCGQAKDNRQDDAFIDPRTLPALPPLVRVSANGPIEVDEEACQTVGVEPGHVTRSIEILNLNAERLWLARAKWRSDLVDAVQRAGDPNRTVAWLRTVLTPDADGRLPRFFTTTRCYFDPLGEGVLEQQPQAWI